MKRAAQGALAVWLVGAIAGVTLLSQAILAKDGREKLLWMNEYVRNVRHFVVTGDLPTLVQKRGPFEIPYFSPLMLAGWLTHPYVRHILPAAVREPLTLATGETTGAFGQASSHKDLLIGLGLVCRWAVEGTGPLREPADRLPRVSADPIRSRWRAARVWPVARPETIRRRSRDHRPPAAHWWFGVDRRLRPLSVDGLHCARRRLISDRVVRLPPAVGDWLGVERR